MIRVSATGLPSLAVVAAGLFAFMILLLAARLRRGPGAGESGAKRSGRSVIGIVAQGLGIAIVAIGPIRVVLDPLSTEAMVLAALTALPMVCAIALFFWSSRTMGRQWSLVARTRTDHALVVSGPFARMRHPIYVAMTLVMFSIAIGYGHVALMLGGAPVFIFGTWLRVSEEERLLREMFGPVYDNYAARVPRFIPRPY